METLIVDVETDNLLDMMTRLWTIQIGDENTDEATVYADQPGYPPLEDAIARLKAADRTVFHNGFGFDLWAINRFYPGTIVPSKMFDTLVACRLLDPERDANSLESWGHELNILKGQYTGDFSAFTEDLVTYAKQDITVTRAVYKHVTTKLKDWGQSLDLEMETAWAVANQMRNGFMLDVSKAQELEATLRGEVAAMTEELRDVFPPMWVPADKKPFVPKITSKASGYTAGVPLTKVKLEYFNPGSRHQVGRRLMRLGWRPKAFGKDGSPTLDETVLATLPYPEAKRLVLFFTTQKLLGQLSDGKNGWLKLVKSDNRIYGYVNTNGACTGRMSHSKPNTAQAAKDKRMRELWIPRPGWKLVGIDAEGLEARMLSHYLARWDGGAFGEMLLNGNKERGTDVHSTNAKAVNGAGFKVNRDGAKVILYALVYGAGDGKLGRTVQDNIRDQGLVVPRGNPTTIGKMVRSALAKSMVGIDKLTDAIKVKAAKVGYLVGLDGRRLMVRSEHSALNTLLQGGGAIVMKKALNIFMDTSIVHDNWPDMGLCCNVHDEIQVECLPELAESIGSTFANCITAAGAHFNLRCPLAGAYAVGDNWSQTH